METESYPAPAAELEQRGSSLEQRGSDETGASHGWLSMVGPQVRKLFTTAVETPRIGTVEASIRELHEQELEITRSFRASRSFADSRQNRKDCAEQFIACCIFLNAVVIGLQSDMTLRGNMELARYFQYLNWGMVMIFATEISARIWFSGLAFFNCRGPNATLNMFDLVTVVSSIWDVAAHVFTTPVKLEQISYLRVVRILRIMRAFRVVRVMPFFRELRMMVEGVMKCSKPLLWAVALMMLVTYIFAIMVAQGCTGDALWADGKVDCDFASLGQLMYILFQAITGGRDWGELADYLNEFSGLLAAGLCLYVLVVTFVVVNVITAVFIEGALEQSQDPEAMLIDTIHRRRKWLIDVKRFFDQCSTDDSGASSIDELMQILNQNDARSSLRALGIDAENVDVNVLRCILDKNGDGTVTLDEFVHCLQGLRGNARSSDIMIIRADIKKLMQAVRQGCQLRPSNLAGAT